MQVPLWRKTAISSCTEIMDKEFHAWLSESLCRDFFLYEITFFYVFDLCNTFSSIINECMQKSESDCHQKERVQFKDQDFLARFSCIIEITLCEKFHRKKTSWYDMRPLDQKELNIWVWNCIKELCKESGEVLGLTSNHLKVGPQQTLRASPSWHFPKNASTFTRIDILRRSTSAKPYFVHFRQKFIFFWNGPKWPRWAQEGPKWSKTLRLAILVPFGLLWQVEKPTMFGHFWSKMNHFWPIPNDMR